MTNKITKDENLENKKKVTLETIGFENGCLPITNVFIIYAEKVKGGYSVTLTATPASTNIRFLVKTITEVKVLVKTLSNDTLTIETPNGTFS